MKVEYLTKRNYLTTDPYIGLSTVKDQLLENEAIVVLDNNRFVGVLTTNDLVNKPKTLVVDCLKDKVVIDSNQSITEVLSIMNEHNTDVLAVSENETVVGLVFKKDLYKYITEYNLELQNKIKERTQELQDTIAMKDLLYSVVAHDLRSPFSSIIGLSELIIENIGTYTTDKIKNQIGQIHYQSKLTYNLLDNLLNWASAQVGDIAFNPCLCNLTLMCDDVIRPLRISAQMKNISVQCFHSTDASIFADKNMVQTILRNLISNAIKYTEVGGEIKIFSTLENRFIEVTVSDNGMGMSDLDKEILFSGDLKSPKLGTFEEKGFGLGLLICKDFVEKHGGTIRIEEKYGKGCDFKFTLPAY